jgi:hypothetical protein
LLGVRATVYRGHSLSTNMHRAKNPAMPHRTPAPTSLDSAPDSAPPSSKSGVYAATASRFALTPEQRTDLRIVRKQNEMILRDGCGRPACDGRHVCMFERQAQITLLAVAALEERTHAGA